MDPIRITIGQVSYPIQPVRKMGFICYELTFKGRQVCFQVNSDKEELEIAYGSSEEDLWLLQLIGMEIANNFFHIEAWQHRFIVEPLVSNGDMSYQVVIDHGAAHFYFNQDGEMRVQTTGQFDSTLLKIMANKIQAHYI